MKADVPNFVLFLVTLQISTGPSEELVHLAKAAFKSLLRFL
jgi:hypothetical protein